MLEREHLEAFVTVADELHFGRAAQRLGVAQSAISKRLKRLEDVLGGRLLERGSRTQVRLTREGAIFLPEARAALESLKATQRIGRSVLSGVAGPLRIGYVFSGAMTGTLSRLVRRLSQRFPELDIVPTLMETPAQLEALAAGRIDVGIIRPRPDYPARLSLHDIHREGMLVAMNADHPLALRDTVTPTDLAGCTFIVPQFHEAAGFVETVRQIAQVGGFPSPRIIASADFITAASLAAAGVGIVVAPVSLGRIAIDDLACRPLAGFPGVLSLYTVAAPTRSRLLRELMPVIPFPQSMPDPAAPPP